MLGERIQADASQQISQAHGEAREASEITNRVGAEALEILRQVVLFQQQGVQKRDHMLSEMQSKMQKLMIKTRQQDELIQELSNAKRVEVETPNLQAPSSPRHPIAHPSLFDLPHTDPSPGNPSVPFQTATSKATHWRGCPSSTIPACPITIAKSWPPPSWLGQGQVQGMLSLPNVAGTNVEDQIHGLA